MTIPNLTRGGGLVLVSDGVLWIISSLIQYSGQILVIAVDAVSSFDLGGNEKSSPYRNSGVFL